MLKLLRRLSNMDQFRLIVLFLIAMILSACSPSSSKTISDVEPSDTTPPIIIAIAPEGDEVGFEVDGQIRIEFSELINEVSLVEEESIILYSATVEDEDTVLYKTESEVVVETEIDRGEKLDEATDINSTTDVSVLYVTPTLGRFAMNNRYVISVESSLRDLVEDDLDTSEDERNYFEGPRAVTFSTASGNWKELGATTELAKNGDGNLKVVSSPITLPVTGSNNTGDLFYARVSNNSEIYASKFSHYSNNWLNNNVEVADECLSWSEETEGEGCENSVLVNKDMVGTISELKLSVSENYAVLTWLQPIAVGAGKALWISVYSDGEWSEPNNVNLPFSADTGIDITMHSVSINADRALISWRSIEESNEIVRAVSFNIADGLLNKDYGDRLVIIDRTVVEELNVLNINTVWLNDTSGVLLWTQYYDSDTEDSESGIYQIYEREVNFIPPEGESSQGRFDWLETRLVDRYQFESDRDVGSVVSFKPVVDSKGDLSILWKKYDGRLDNLWFAKRVQKVWSTAEKLENNQAGSVFEYEAIFDSKDKLMIVWTQENQDGDTTVYFKSRHAGTNEESNEELRTNTSIRNLNMIFDYEGNGHLFWVEPENTSNIISTTFFSKISKSWSDVSSLTASSIGGAIKEINLSTLYKDGRVLMLLNEVSYDKQNINQLIFE